MVMCTLFLLRFGFENEVLKPYDALFNLSRDLFA